MKIVKGEFKEISREGNLEYEVEEESSLDLVLLGDGSTKREITINLNGKNASAALRGLFTGKDDDSVSVDITFNHNSPDTVSDMKIRSILDGRAKVECNGLISIKPDASGSVGSQDQRAILLSDRSSAKFIPSLNIENNDVKVSHSSSIGKLDQESLFYLMSRGLTEKEATESLIEGFAAPMREAV